MNVGIYIKDMTMPVTCCDCHFCGDDAMCSVLGEDLFNYLEGVTYVPDDWKCDDCPLVEVPAHGRLVDADADIQVIVTMKANRKCSVDFVAPTVIPAEEGET